MATSGRYDDYEDPGMAFTEGELKAYDMQALAQERVDKLVSGVLRPAQRRMDLNLQYPAFCGILVRETKSIVTWYGVALELPMVRSTIDDLLEREDPMSAEGKRITKAAQQMDFDVLLNQWEQNALGVMRRAVTIGRRCSSATKVSGWTKADKSRSNKLANCLDREVNSVEKMIVKLEARK